VLGYYQEIDGVTYYIHKSVTGLDRSNAEYIFRAEANNMKMISFEDDEQKWTQVKRYLASTGI
jgi:hypothetical protein